MALKTFNINESVYERFSRFCKGNGISMSKQVEIFMASQVEDEPVARADYMKRLERIRKGKFVGVKSFAKRYGLSG